MSSTEIPLVLADRMEREEFLTGTGLYGLEAMKQRGMVQHGKILCGIIHSSAEKWSLPTDLLGPGPFTGSPSLNDLKSVAKILEKHTVEITNEDQTRAFNSTLYRSKLHIEALQAHEYLGKFISNSVKEKMVHYDCLIKLPIELYKEFVAITSDYAFGGAEISLIDDQLMKLTEKVALASDQEKATTFSGIGYRLTLLRKAIETYQHLEKLIHSSLVKALPPSVVFLRSHEEILEDTVPLLYAPLARARFSSMIPKEDVETYERLGITMDNLHVLKTDIPAEKTNDFFKICWREELHGLKDALKNVRKMDHMAIISSSILAITAQAGGAFLSSAFADPPSNPSKKWVLDFVEAGLLAGFGLTIGGMGIRRIKPDLSGFVIKSGAIATAWAFIAAMAMPLSPALAWTVGPAAAAFVAISIGKA